MLSIHVSSWCLKYRRGCHEVHMFNSWSLLALAQEVKLAVQLSSYLPHKNAVRVFIKTHNVIFFSFVRSEGHLLFDYLAQFRDDQGEKDIWIPKYGKALPRLLTLFLGMNSTEPNSSASVRPKVPSDIQEGTVPDNTSSVGGEKGTNRTLPVLQVVNHQQGPHHRHILKLLPSMEATAGEKSSTPVKGPKRGHPRQNLHKHFDINEHLPWMIVLFLLLVLVVIVVCSVRKSSRTLKKGPRQDPSAIVEKAGLKKSVTPTQNREKWIYYCNGHGEPRLAFSYLKISLPFYPICIF